MLSSGLTSLPPFPTRPRSPDMPTLAERRALYGPEYRKRFSEAKIDPDRIDGLHAAAQRLLNYRARYDAVSAATGVPWWFIAICHKREGDCDFTTHLHNGDSLKARTHNVPAGRPVDGSPPFTWQESAIDALRYDGLDKVQRWDLVEVLLRGEAYNGFGYRKYDEPSPYLWAATNQSDERGKFVSDGRYDPNAPEKQPGFVALMLALMALGVDLGIPDLSQKAIEKPVSGKEPSALPVQPSKAPLPPVKPSVPSGNGAGRIGIGSGILIGLYAAKDWVLAHSDTLVTVAIVAVAAVVLVSLIRHKETP